MDDVRGCWYLLAGPSAVLRIPKVRRGVGYRVGVVARVVRSRLTGGRLRAMASRLRGWDESAGRADDFIVRVDDLSAMMQSTVPR